MTAPFPIIGGYGTVGSHVVSALRAFQPDLPLAIAGRNAAKAQEAAAAHSGVVGLAVDTTREDLGLPADQPFGGIALLTNDLSTYPARYAMQHGIPYTSIATQMSHIGPKLALHVNHSGRSVSLIQDTSFAGTLVVVGLHLAARFERVAKIEIGAVMDAEDAGGPNAVEDGADFAEKAAGLVLENGLWMRLTAAEETRTFTTLDGSAYEGTSFPSIDVAELAARTNVASARLDFILGVSPQRKAGGTPSVDIVYEIEGTLPGGERSALKAQLTHPEGQSVLTALGVAVAIETLVGSVGEVPSNGIYLPSSLLSPDHMLARLQERGAVLQFAP